jgi:hypothetical protein
MDPWFMLWLWSWSPHNIFFNYWNIFLIMKYPQFLRRRDMLVTWVSSIGCWASHLAYFEKQCYVAFFFLCRGKEKNNKKNQIWKEKKKISNGKKTTRSLRGSVQHLFVSQSAQLLPSIKEWWKDESWIINHSLNEVNNMCISVSCRNSFPYQSQSRLAIWYTFNMSKAIVPCHLKAVKNSLQLYIHIGSNTSQLCFFNP